MNADVREALARHLFAEHHAGHEHPDDPSGDPWDRLIPMVRDQWLNKAHRILRVITAILGEGWDRS